MSVTSSKDLPPVTPEQALLESLFLSLRQFAFDKAKDIVEKERESSQKLQPGSYWLHFLSQMLSFIAVEKAYVTLVITPPTRSGFLKTLTPKMSYDKLCQEFKDLEVLGAKSNTQQQPSSSSLARGGAGVRSISQSSVEKLLAHLCGQLADYMLARTETMVFYDQIAASNISKQLNYATLTRDMTAIIQRHHKNFHHPILSPIKTGFAYECEILRHLLQAQQDIHQHHFLPALLSLNDAKQKLASWSPVGTAKAESWSLLSWSVSPSPKRAAIPNLYQWLTTLNDNTVSKFTLYFYDILSKQTNPADMKIMTAKTSIDYVQKLSSFQRKHNIDYIGIVLDTSELLEPYKGGGYHHPEKSGGKLAGLSSYPAIFNLPPEPWHPQIQQCWPSVIMFIVDRKNKELSVYDHVSSCCEARQDACFTYFFTRLDTVTVLTLICLDGRSEKDGHITNFMVEISQLLRAAKLYSALRPHSR